MIAKFDYEIKRVFGRKIFSEALKIRLRESIIYFVSIRWVNNSINNCHSAENTDMMWKSIEKGRSCPKIKVEYQHP